MRPFSLSLLIAATLAASAASAAPAGGDATGLHAHHAHGTPRTAATNTWTQLPLLLPARGGERGDRSTARFALANLEAATLTVYTPRAADEDAPQQVPVTAGSATYRAPRGSGNYHWVSARQESRDSVATAGTAYYFSNPGPAPTELLLKRKGELELIPQPLPREHGRYREGETWPFLARFNGAPLSGGTVVLETEHGTREMFPTNDQGIARITFPRDFVKRDATGGNGHAGHGPQRADFVLAITHNDGTRYYQTTFNYSYSPHALEGRSLWAGAGFVVLGMVLAAPLLRRRKKGA
jgi:hypothetical protein